MRRHWKRWKHLKQNIDSGMWNDFGVVEKQQELVWAFHCQNTVNRNLESDIIHIIKCLVVQSIHIYVSILVIWICHIRMAVGVQFDFQRSEFGCDSGSDKE